MEENRERVVYLIEFIIDELQDSLDEVSDVGEEFVVVLGLEVSPLEVCIVLLWTIDQEVVSPDFNGDASAFSVVTKDSDGFWFRELGGFVLQVLRGGHCLEEGPVFACSKKSSRENDTVEGNVVLSDELVQVYVLWVLPPGFPVFNEVRSDRRVSNRSIEPDVHDFLFPARQGNRCAPLQISRYASVSQASLDPCFRCPVGVVTPVSVLWLSVIRYIFRKPFSLFVEKLPINKCFDFRFELREIEEAVSGFLDDWGVLADGAFRVDEFSRVDEFAALIALITVAVIVLAEWAGTIDVTIG